MGQELPLCLVDDISYLLLHDNITTHLGAWNNPHLLSHGFYGSGAQAWPSWVLCKATVKMLMGLQLRLPCSPDCGTIPFPVDSVSHWPWAGVLPQCLATWLSPQAAHCTAACFSKASRARSPPQMGITVLCTVSTYTQSYTSHSLCYILLLKTMS